MGPCGFSLNGIVFLARVDLSLIGTRIGIPIKFVAIALGMPDLDGWAETVACTCTCYVMVADSQTTDGMLAQTNTTLSADRIQHTVQ